MKLKFFLLVLTFSIKAATSAQSSACYITYRFDEYKLLFILPNIMKVGGDAVDAEIDSVLEGSLRDMVNGLSPADKTALGFGIAADKPKLEKFLLNNFNIWEFDTETVAEKERNDYIKTFEGIGYTICTIKPTSPPVAFKQIKFVHPLKGVIHYPVNTIARMKESGKKDFLASLKIFNLIVNYADWREDKIKAYLARGFDDITDTITFAEKNHDYFGKIDQKTGVTMIYEIGYIPKDNGRGRVYEESFYMGMRPEMQASGTPAEQMEFFKETYDNIKAMIVKEAGKYTTSLSTIVKPYSEADLNDGVKFMKALKEGKLSYSTAWYSGGKPSKEKPVIYMEIHPSQMIKIRMTQNEVAE